MYVRHFSLPHKTLSSPQADAGKGMGERKIKTVKAGN